MKKGEEKQQRETGSKDGKVVIEGEAAELYSSDTSKKPKLNVQTSKTEKSVCVGVHVCVSMSVSACECVGGRQGRQAAWSNLLQKHLKKQHKTGTITSTLTAFPAVCVFMNVFVWVCSGV